MRLSIKDKIIYSVFVGVVAAMITVGLIWRIVIGQSGFMSILPNEWARFPGAEVSNNTVHIKPIGRVLTHTDTSAAQFNSPVNVSGAHLEVSGDFQIKIAMSELSNGANFKLFGRVPNIYDEWRQERESMSIEVNNMMLKMRVWDGTSPFSVDERITKRALKDDETLVISHKGNRIVIQQGNMILGDMPDHNVFSKGTIWFGADASLGTDGWIIKSLQVRGLGRGRARIITAPSMFEQNNKNDTLRNLAAVNPRHILIGSAVAVHPLFTDDQYRKIALSEFSIMTPENSMKPEFIHPQKNLYTFQNADDLVEAAQKNRIAVHGHSLVLSKANPMWMQMSPESERQEVMTNHIKNIVGHFRGKVSEWDVVNEPLSGDDMDYKNENLGLRKQVWFDAMGENYIDIAFRTAHAVDPAAKLYLNDFGMENDGKRFDAMLALVKRLKDRGVPIYGVGFEAHIYHSPADIIRPNELRQHIQALAALGVYSRISEIDVLGDKSDEQTEQYSSILKVCLAELTCTSYTTWGITDLYGSTTTSDRYPAKLGDSLLWDDTYKPKPALGSLRDAFKN